MKKHFDKIISLVLCILLIVSLMQISALKKQVNGLQQSLWDMSSDLADRMTNVAGQVHHELEQGANVLAEVNYEYGEIDARAKTAQLLVRAVPREYNPETTTATLVLQDKEYPLHYADGAYAGAIDIPLFEDVDREGRIVLNDGGTLRTQMLDWYLCPREGCLLSVYASYSGSTAYPQQGGGLDYAANWLLNIDLFKNGSYRLQSMDLVTELNGREVTRMPIDFTAEGQAGYRDGAREDDPAVHLPEPGALPADDMFEGSVGLIFPVQQTWTIPANSTLTHYVDVVETSGLRYRVYLDGMVTDAHGCADESATSALDDAHWTGSASVWSPDGPLLYQP